MRDYWLLFLPWNIWEAADFSGLILWFSNEIYLDFSFLQYMLQLKHRITNNWRCWGKTLKMRWNENKIWQKRGCWIRFLQSSIDSECWGLDLIAFISWRSANNPLDVYNRKTQMDSSCPHLIKLWKRQKQINGGTDGKGMQSVREDEGERERYVNEGNWSEIPPVVVGCSVSIFVCVWQSRSVQMNNRAMWFIAYRTS